jgi:sulfate adenylyltransferase subunit 2
MKSGESYTLTTLQALETESIHIIREVAAEFENPVMLYSVGKDSSVMAHLAIKAFYPERVPFPLLHVDTGCKFPEMYAFRDTFVQKNNLRLVVYRNEEALLGGANPFDLGTVKCCAELKTKALLDALRQGGYDAAFGGARRDEEKSRSKERIYSFRDKYGQWDPKNQRPELWNLYNGKIDKGESIRVFPLSNWTELDIWTYIHHENIPVVPLYFAQKRRVIDRRGQLIPVYPGTRVNAGEEITELMCRFRTLGCHFCTGAVRSTAASLPEIIGEMMVARYSERITRVIDHDQDSSMEQKKREGYF